jgi:phage shock protein PspC (stress-responsive transcriptional regulator)
MSSMTRKSEWTVLLGVALLALGAWLLAERVFGWIFFPLAQVLHVLGNVGWPLVLVGLGVLLIMRGRNGGWTTTGKLFRSRTDRKIGGVLGGAAVYFGIDASLARVGYVLLTLLTGFWLGFFVYVIAMAVVPEEQFDYGVQGSAPAAPPVPPAPPAPSTTVAPPAPPATSSAV